MMSKLDSYAHSVVGIGDIFGQPDPNYPGRWRITNRGPKNASLTHEDTGKGLRCPYGLLIEPPARDPDAPPPPDRPDHLRCGQLVEWPAAAAKARIPGSAPIFIVLQDKGDRVNVVPLGGFGRSGYWRAPAVQLKPVDPATVNLTVNGAAVIYNTAH